MKGMTERQRQVLSYAAQFRRTRGYAPSIREIGIEFGIHSLRGVTVHLDALERKGFLRRVPGVARGLMLTASGRAAVAAYLNGQKNGTEREAR